MNGTLSQTKTFLAVLLTICMILSIPAVVATAAVATPVGPDADGTTNGDTPADNTTVPTDASALDTAETVLADQPGDASVARSQLALARKLGAISADSSASQHDRAIATADAVFEHRKQMAASPDKPLPPSMVGQFETSQTKLEGVQALLETDQERKAANGMSGAITKAKKGTKLQAALADDSMTLASDLPDIETQNHASPSAATMALMERYGVSPTAADVAAMQELDDLPEPTRSALTDYLDAFLAFQRTTAEGDITRTFAARNQLLDATADLDNALETPDAPGIATPQHSGDVSQAGIQVDAATQKSKKTQIGCVKASVHKGITQPVSADPVHSYDQEVGVQIDGHFCVLQYSLQAIHGGPYNNNYTHNAVVQIDDGGDDEYHMNAGGTNLDDDTSDKNNPFDRSAFEEQHGATNVTNPLDPVPFFGNNKLVPINNSADYDVAAALFDDGSGNDNYTRKKAYGWGQRGGAHIGSGFLVDMGGSDRYGDNSSEMYGSQSALDSHFGTNGGAVGLLSDTQDCCRDTVATGFLLDAGSSNAKDRYRAGSAGANGGAAKGGQQTAGFLMDMDGPSNYKAYSFGVNGGASEAQALLVDRGDESDTYTSTKAGTNGGALYTGVSVTGAECPGTAPCSPGGFLVDEGGVDNYYATSEGVNGGGSEQGNGFLFDAGSTGGDHFQAGQETASSADKRRTAPSFGTGPVSSFAGLKGVNGGGYEIAVGALINQDSNGADESTYFAGDGLGSNGGGALAGSGLIVDTGGEDNYTAGINYTEGTFNNPNSFAEITRPSAGSNGGGATGGAGSIVDTGGSDSYIATRGQFGGVNGTIGGGWALGTGGGAAGLVVDNDGSDTYKVTSDRGPISGVNGGGSGLGESTITDIVAPTFDVLCKAGGPCQKPPRPAALRATGTLVDNGTNKEVPGVGNGLKDDYIVDSTAAGDEHVAGANGGAYGLTSTGLLVDQQGDDETYKTVASNKTLGVNGGVNVPLTSSPPVNGPSATGAAVLLDAAGSGDDYTQNCGSGTDDTWAPKGIAGAQIDLEQDNGKPDTTLASKPGTCPDPI